MTFNLTKDEIWLLKALRFSADAYRQRRRGDRIERENFHEATRLWFAYLRGSHDTASGTCSGHRFPVKRGIKKYERPICYARSP